MPAERSRSAATTVVGLLLCLGVGSLPFPVWVDEQGGTLHLLAVEAIYATVLVTVLCHVRWCERRPLSSIGFRGPAFGDLATALLFAVVTVAGLAAIYFWLFPQLQADEGQAVDRLRAQPTWWLVLSVIRAGTTEEVLFRGYPIERIREATGNRGLAVALPWSVFTLAHVGPWGWSHVLIAGFGGLMLTLLYVWRRSLWANIVAHCLIDGVAVAS